MTGRLNVSTEELLDLGRNLRTVAIEFDEADGGAEWIAGAIGHQGLSDRVVRFAGDWDDRRADLLEGIANLAEATTAVGEELSNADEELGAALRGEI